MATVGSAEVVVRAITNKVRDDIQRAFRDAGPTVDAAGAAHGRRYADSFSAGLNQHIRPGIQAALDAATAPLSGPGGPGGRMARGVADGFAGGFVPAATAAGAAGGAGAARGFLTAFSQVDPGSVAASQSLTRLIAVGNIMGAVFSGLIGSISTMVSGLFAMASAASQAAAALAVIPGLYGAFAQVFGVAKLGFGGVGEAIKAGTKAQDTATASTTRATAATNAATAAQSRLNSAREEAEARIKRLGKIAEDANYDLDSANQKYETANDRLNKVLSDPLASAAERAKAEADLAKAKKAVTGAAGDQEKAEKKYQAAKDKGVAGNAKVKKAEKDLEKARKAGGAGSLSPAAKAADAYNQALAKLSPEAREFVKQVLKMQETLKLFRTEAQSKMFPPLTRALKIFDKGLKDTGTKTVPSLLKSVGATAESVGTMGEQFAKAAFEGDGLLRTQQIFAGNNKIISVFTKENAKGQSAVSALALALQNLLLAIQPITERFANWIRQLLISGTAADGAVGSVSKMQDRLKTAGDVAAQLGRIVGGLWRSLSNLGSAATPAGQGLLDSFEAVVVGADKSKQSLDDNRTSLEDFTAKLKEDGTATNFFNKVADNLRALGDLVNVVGATFIGLGDNKGIGDFAKSVEPAVENLGKIMDNFNSQGGSFAEVLNNLSETALLFADSSGIGFFFDTLNLIISGFNKLFDIPGVKWIVGITSALFAVRTAINFSLGAISPILKGAFGSLDETKKHISDIGLAFDKPRQALGNFISKIPGLSKLGEKIKPPERPEPADASPEAAEGRAQGNSVGKAIAQGMADGIGEHSALVIQAIDEMVEELITAVKQRLGIASPSRVMHEIGEDTGRGYVGGVDSQEDDARRAGSDLANATAQGAAGANIGDALDLGLDDALDDAAGKLDLSDTVSQLDVLGDSMEKTEKKRGLLGRGMDRAKGGFGKFAGGLKLLGGGMLGLVGGPLGALMLALPLLIKGFQLLYDKSPGFRKFIDQLKKSFEAVVKAVMPVLKAIGEWLLGVLDKFFTWVSAHMPQIKAFFSDVGSVINNVVQNVILPVWNNALMPALEGLWKFVSFAFPLLIKYWQFLFNAIKFAITNIFIPAWNNILLPAIKTVVNIFQTVFPIVGKVIGTVFGLIKGYITNIFLPYWRMIFSALRTLINIARTVFGAFWGVISKVFNQVKSIWNGVLRPVFEGIRNTVSNVFSRVSGVVNGFITTFTKVKNKIANLVNNIISKFGEIGGGISNAFSNLGDFAKGGINSFIKFINDKLIGTVNKVTGKFGLTIPTIKGFSEGGHTGAGPKNRIAGVVHADEHVIRKASRRRMERENPGLLDYVNTHGRLPSGYSPGVGGWGPLPSPSEMVKGVKNLSGMAVDGIKDVGKTIAKKGLGTVLDTIIGVAKGGMGAFGIKRGVLFNDFFYGVMDELQKTAKKWGGKAGEQPKEVHSSVPKSGPVTADPNIAPGSWTSPLRGSFPVTQGANSGHRPSWAVDFGAPGGTIVQAATSGSVVSARDLGATSYGKYLILQHANGIRTLYAHLSQFLKTSGTVAAGQAIARSGNTGGVRGAGGGYHLHFEIMPSSDTLAELRKRGVRLAKGGVARATPGGVLSVIAEAGQHERVEPLDKDGFSKRDRAMLDAIRESGRGGMAVTINNPERERASESVTDVLRRTAFDNGWN